MDHNTISAQWEGFRAMVIHPDATPNQLKAMRMAFHAGAVCALSILAGMADASEEVVAAMSESLAEECADYADSLLPDGD